MSQSSKGITREPHGNSTSFSNEALWPMWYCFDYGHQPLRCQEGKSQSTQSRIQCCGINHSYIYMILSFCSVCCPAPYHHLPAPLPQPLQSWLSFLRLCLTSFATEASPETLEILQCNLSSAFLGDVLLMFHLACPPKYPQWHWDPLGFENLETPRIASIGHYEVGSIVHCDDNMPKIQLHL